MVFRSSIFSSFGILVGHNGFINPLSAYFYKRIQVMHGFGLSSQVCYNGIMMQENYPKPAG